MNVYQPEDDSYLMQTCVKKFVKPSMRVLDMGTGSGIQAETAFKLGAVVHAVDKNPLAVQLVKKKIPKAEVYESDLFNEISEKFDIIIFNAPYLPNDENDPDIALDGGPGGYEIIIKFLEEAKNYLTINGKILLLFSSLSNKDIIEKHAKKNYVFEEIAQLAMFFEKLYVYKFEKK